MKRFVLMFLSWVVIFSLIVVGFFYIKNREGTGIEETEIPEDVEEVEAPDEDLTFVMMGVDAKGEEDTMGQRTDTIMLCKYFSDTHKLSVMSIPRDTLVEIPGYGEDKINHAHAFEGPELTLETINQTFDMNVKYYVRVDYDVVKEVVDAINGVEVDVPVDMHYEDPYADPPLKIDLKKGKQTLDGKKALQFLRFRSGYPDQDLGRIRAQQAFVQAVLEKAKNPIYILKAPVILKATSENIDTNMSVSTILSYVTAVTKISMDNTQFETLPADPTMIDGISYMIMRYGEAEEMIHDLFEVRKVQKENDEYEETEEGTQNTDGTDYTDDGSGDYYYDDGQGYDGSQQYYDNSGMYYDNQGYGY